MNRFHDLLYRRAPTTGDRRWLYVPYDQLTDRIGPLAREDPEDLGIVLIENSWKAARRPYHKQKLAIVLANQRHFALEQAKRGVAVRYEHGDGPYREILQPILDELGPMRAMVPAERELRVDLQPLVEEAVLEPLDHEGWLTTHDQFRASQGDGGPPWRMDAFYRHVRRETGILMQDGKPQGGKYSFDSENRRRWSGDPPSPEPPRFAVDEVTAEVGALIEDYFAHHPGYLDLETLPATAEDAKRLWEWAKRECLEHFGPYQDATSSKTASLFHTRISPLLHLHRLLPKEVVNDVTGLDAPIPSVEGFVRQVLGWREFVRHVHWATDGFRRMPDGQDPLVAEQPGDGGYERWAGSVWDGSQSDRLDGGASPSALGAGRGLPTAFWGDPSGLNCLDRVVDDVWHTGYGHHITRLMVLANLATLLDVEPRQLTDWFWSAYIDAYDWVVEPNVLGMGSYAVGDLMTTKPYVSGAAYIHRMGDYCSRCRFDPSDSCPITSLYWSFLDRHNDALKDNPRLRLPMSNLENRSQGRRGQDGAVFRWVTDTLARGAELRPEDAPQDD